jgi:hypothetical protein
MKFLKKYESTAYFDIHIYQDDYNLNVSEDEVNMLIKSGFDIYWSDGHGGYLNAGYRYDGKTVDLMEYLSEFREVSNDIKPDDFVNIKKYNL